MFVYIQAYFLGFLAIMAVLIVAWIGGGTGFTLRDRTYTGSGALALGAVHAAAVLVLVVLAVKASRGSDGARLGLMGSEVLLGIYWIAWVNADVGAWLLGPGLCLAVIAAFNWPWLQQLRGGHADAEPTKTPDAVAAGDEPADGEDRAPQT